MTRSRRRLARWASLAGLLLLGLLISGLLAMHGLQATSPSDMSGIPVAGQGGMHRTAVQDPSKDPMAPAAPMPGHDHPGGQVCLGLLVLAFVLALVSLGFTARTANRARPRGWRMRRLVRLLGRPPPSIYDLAVLRL